MTTKSRKKFAGSSPMKGFTRREFLLASAAATAGCLTLPGRLFAAEKAPLPSYLKGYELLYQQNPRAAALRWFREAKFGLFMHFGLYSLLGRGEWVQLRNKIHVAEYARLKDRFTAEKFDPDFITDLALAAQMRYVNITTRHHDSFCLFKTNQTDFNSVNSPAKRDLVGELAVACRKKGLGLCFYYSHGRDWRHPDAPNNDEWGSNARPNYETPDPAYHYGKDHDLKRYREFVTAQITELLTQYGPVAAIWLDGIGVPLSRPDRIPEFQCQELYDLIHRLQPQVLVSYKQGLLGTEDFFAPEIRAVKNENGKPMEICDTIQRGGWGYREHTDRLNANQVMTRLSAAAQAPANLLLNTGPLPDGSILPDDVVTLRDVGRQLSLKGFPKESQSKGDQAK